MSSAQSEVGAQPAAVTELLDHHDAGGSTEKCFLIVVPATFFCCVASMFATVSYYGWSKAAKDLVDMVEHHENETSRAITLVMANAVLTILCLPGPPFVMILTGFFFGLAKGFVLNFTGEFLAMTGSILVGRHLLAGRVRRWMTRHKVLQEAVEVLEDGSANLRFLILFRIVPFIPIWVKNYAMAELHVSWPTAVFCFLPASLLYVTIFSYVGTKGFTLAHQLTGNAGQTTSPEVFSTLERWFVGVGFVSVTLLCILGRQEYYRRRSASGRGD